MLSIKIFTIFPYLIWPFILHLQYWMSLEMRNLTKGQNQTYQSQSRDPELVATPISPPLFSYRFLRFQLTHDRDLWPTVWGTE